MTNLTIDEIISLYVRARNREEEVYILADLTASDTETILEILNDAGVYTGGYRACPRCGKQFPVLKKFKKTKECSDCHKLGKRIATLKSDLKKIAQTMNDLGRLSARKRKELDELEAVYTKYDEKYCEECKYFMCESYCGDEPIWMCNNPLSDEYCNYVDFKDSCSEFERRQNGDSKTD